MWTGINNSVEVRTQYRLMRDKGTEAGGTAALVEPTCAACVQQTSVAPEIVMKRLLFPFMLAAFAAGCASSPNRSDDTTAATHPNGVSDDRPYRGTSGHIGIGAGRWGGRSGGSIGIGVGF